MAFAQLDQAKEMMAQAGAQPGVPEANTKMVVAYLDFIKEYIPQLDSLSLKVTPEPDMLGLSLKLAARPDSELARLLVRDPAMKQGYRLAGFLNSPAAVKLIAKTNKPLFTKLNTVFVEMFTQAMGGTLSETQIRNWKAMMADSVDNMGHEAAIAFSFAPAMPPVAIKEVIYVTNPKAVLDRMNMSMQLANDIYKSMGIDATLAVQPEGQLYKGVQIHALKFDMKAPPEAGEAEKMMVESMLSSAFNFKFAAADSFMLVAGGPDADRDLRQLIDQALSGRDAAATGDIRTAMVVIPDASSTDFVASVNVIRLVSGVGTMMSAMPIPGGQLFGAMFSELNVPTKSCLAIASIGAKLQENMTAGGGESRMVTGPGAAEPGEMTFDFGEMDKPGNTVTLKITGVEDDATEDAITDKLQTMTDGNHSMSWFKMGGVLTVELSPVKDVEAFVRRIDFGTVTKVEERTISVEVSK